MLLVILFTLRFIRRLFGLIMGIMGILTIILFSFIITNSIMTIMVLIKIHFIMFCLGRIKKTDLKINFKHSIIINHQK